MANFTKVWLPEENETLLEKREIELKTFEQIGLEMGRPMQTVYSQYRKIVGEREAREMPTIAPDIEAIPPLHCELGIKTYTHMQALLHSPFDGRWGRGVRNQQVNAHWYRMPITLPKVFA